MIDYELKAFVGPLPLLDTWPRLTPALRPVPLRGGLALLPVTAGMAPAEAWGDRYAGAGPLALIEADWCGGVGGERARTWRSGVRVEQPSVADALRGIGAPPEVQAVGLLRHLSTRAWTACAIVEALAKASRDPLSGLVKGLTWSGDGETEPLVRVEAAERLGRLGRGGRPALPALRDAMRREQRPLMRAAASALARIGAEGIPMLLAALDDPTVVDRQPIVFALGLAGREGATALPALVRLLASDPVPQVRATCAEVLGRIAPDDSVAPLAAALTDEAANVRTRAAEGLGRVRDLHGPPLAALRQAADDPDPDVRGAASDALHRLDAG